MKLLQKIHKLTNPDVFLYSVDLRCFEKGHVQSTEVWSAHFQICFLLDVISVLYWFRDRDAT